MVNFVYDYLSTVGIVVNIKWVIYSRLSQNFVY